MTSRDLFSNHNDDLEALADERSDRMDLAGRWDNRQHQYWRAFATCVLRITSLPKAQHKQLGTTISKIVHKH